MDSLLNSRAEKNNLTNATSTRAQEQVPPMNHEQCFRYSSPQWDIVSRQDGPQSLSPEYFHRVEILISESCVFTCQVLISYFNERMNETTNRRAAFSEGRHLILPAALRTTDRQSIDSSDGREVVANRNVNDPNPEQK